MFGVGDEVGMEDYLKRSLSVTPYSASETVSNWEENFKSYAREDGKSLELKMWQKLKNKFPLTIQ
jgi:hypothetical protein